MSLIQNVEKNNLDELERLIRNGVDVNGVDGDGYTALWVAASLGYLECATTLIEAKADVNKADAYGSTPLYQSSYHGYTECIRVGWLRCLEYD
jgi:ankyrin repeat protein